MDGEKYKATSLRAQRHALQRFILQKRDIDIIKDVRFDKANRCFQAVLAELKREGKGSIDHHAVIEEGDLKKLYSSLYFQTNTPVVLFTKVQFDIRLYFFRRGAENMHKMTKDSFCIPSDPISGLRYVCKNRDELTKNHREDDKESSGEGVMPEIRGDANCPVASFEKYISKLHPDCNRLWQRTRDSFVECDSCWYCNAPVGEKTLQKFMTGLSKCCELSQTYSNHCIRATGATILSRSSFSPAQIMAVTGHKSVSSLSVYQRVGESEKVAMGQSLTRSLSTQGPSTQRFSEFDNLELEDLNLDDFQDMFPKSSVSSLPTFHKCKVKTITVNHHYHIHH